MATTPLTWSDNSTGGGARTVGGAPLTPRVHMFTDISVRYIFLVIIIIGSVGNGLSFLVLVRKRLRSNSLYFYLMALTLADTLVLYISCLKTWVRMVTGFELLHVSAASCKVVAYVLLVSMHMAAWLVVLVTFDRFMSVWFPFRAATICTAKRARGISACLLLALAVYHAHVFWTIDLYVEPPAVHLRCLPRPDYQFMKQPFEYLKLATYSFIPFMSVFMLNLAIIFKITHGPRALTSSELMMARVCVTNRQYHQKSSRMRSVRQQKVIYMLLTLSFSWLLLTAPYAVVSVILTAAPDLLNNNQAVFCKTLAFLLLYLNHSINFYLYCMTGTKFRHEFSELFSRYARRWRHRRGNHRKSTKRAQAPLLVNLRELGVEKPRPEPAEIESNANVQQGSSLVRDTELAGQTSHTI